MSKFVKLSLESCSIFSVYNIIYTLYIYSQQTCLDWYYQNNHVKFSIAPKGCLISHVHEKVHNQTADRCSHTIVSQSDSLTIQLNSSNLYDKCILAIYMTVQFTRKKTTNAVCFVLSKWYICAVICCSNGVSNCSCLLWPNRSLSIHPSHQVLFLQVYKTRSTSLVPPNKVVL